jgi:RNA polymerase sigma-70 factor, ECF subfamily
MMSRGSVRTAVAYNRLIERELVVLARGGDEHAFREIMARHNRRLFRIARSIIRDDTEAEDVLQESYTRAFSAFGGYRGDATLFTWLTAIVINEARGRLRRRRATVNLDQIEIAQRSGAEIVMFPAQFAMSNPEEEFARSEMRRFLEHAIDALPEPFRLVFILREVEGCSVQETAATLGLNQETVKTRAFRARRLLRKELDQKLSSAISEAYPFLGPRCARLTENVLNRLNACFGWHADTDPAGSVISK